MLYVVCYDISDARRLRNVAKVMRDMGERVQKSVFECELDDEGHARMLARVRVVMNMKEDSVRVYRLCAACRKKREAYGIGDVVEPPEVYVV